MKKLVDQKARDLIKTALDENILVEAAAGTGKTTELINRMVSVIANGRAEIREMAAVTFTDKAAGELKLRLRSRLALEMREAQDSAARRRLQEASAHLEEAQVSTIHGFCADLLRERPVEAGVDPGFETFGEPEAERVYGQAFDLWLQEKLDAPPEGVRRALRRHSKEDPAERLRRAGWELARWRDFDAPWRREPFARESEIDALVTRLNEFATLTESPTKPTDPFYQCTRKARRLKADLDRIEKVRERDYDGLEADLVSLARDTDDETKRFRNPDKGYGAQYRKGVTRVAVLQEHADFVAALERFAERADADLAALLQSELWESLDRYEKLKTRGGKLDLIDLLLRARNLIRSSERVRADFQQRYKRIFIDEFQDTDPLQVEILMLLAADDPSVDDWRKARPAPGKLFVVGDPKQAIYRFRRAELGIYQQVKKVLEESHARCLNLTTSFRAVPSIQRGVNAAFAPVMTGDPATLQAHYVPLSPFREETGGRPTIVALPVPSPYGQKRLAVSAVERLLPDATAAFVQWLLHSSGWKVTETERSGEAPVSVKARHVCLLFRRLESWGEDAARPYVEALEARDIPHLLVGGKSFHEREEVATMRTALSAVEWPDDELSVFATLKGSLFAIADNALLEYRHTYRRLHPFFIPNEAPASAHVAPIFDALRLLRELHGKRNRRPVAETVARLLENTRAATGFVLRPSGEQALANVLYVAELARQYEASDGISFRGFVERLREEAQSHQAPEAPILEEGSDGVRIMTVHKAKGLEFPVVILADITAKLARPHASRYLASDRGLCAMSIGGWAPAELREHDAEEALRDRAEGVRVAYVAATRARDLLVVPAVGDDPEEARWTMVRDWWVSPLHQAIYPAAEFRRHPSSAAGCPGFGQDSVRRRPSNRVGADNVCPGSHAFQSPPIADGKKTLPYEVTWWDPSALTLDVTRKFGIRQQELLRKGDPEVVERDLETYKEWQARRRAAIEHGSRPTRAVHTATEQAQQPESEAPADCALVEVARKIERPAGPRYGVVVHAVLATVGLEASPDEVRTVAALQGRILGATKAEADSASNVVKAVLQHPLMERARAAMTTGECRRETPVTLCQPDGTVIEGVVDVAFREGETWIVIDFKTDREIEQRLPDYRRQVNLYARAISTATGARASAVLMWV
ncbi:MAG TPA: UvrD-helicase domain-containing protein [Terriglobia bacterium]|nr:UvrD-helicase domain-containing protein [Terriglobia bacterium]